MATRAQIQAAARQYLDVPWRHQGRSVHGIDCGGIIILVGRELGLYDQTFDVKGYARRPNGFSFLDAFRRVNDEKLVSEARPGDIIVLVDGPYPCHTGILTEKQGVLHLVHAYAGLRKTVEEPFTRGRWEPKATHCFTYRGVTD